MKSDATRASSNVTTNEVASSADAATSSSSNLQEKQQQQQQQQQQYGSIRNGPNQYEPKKTTLSNDTDAPKTWWKSVFSFCIWTPDDSSKVDRNNLGKEPADGDRVNTSPSSGEIKTKVNRLSPHQAVNKSTERSLKRDEKNGDQDGGEYTSGGYSTCDSRSQVDGLGWETTSNYAGSSYTESSGFVGITNDNQLPDMYGEVNKPKKKKKKKKSRNGSVASSNGSEHSGSGSDALEMDTTSIALEFVSIMQGGMNLLAATASGSTRAVTVVTDGRVFSWGLPKSKPIMSVSLSSISFVQKGMPPRLVKAFLISDIERSFHLVLRDNKKAATFLAPTALERDALVHGFQSLLAMCIGEKATGVNVRNSDYNNKDCDEDKAGDR